MLLAMVGHELRSPLSTIVSGAKLLARYPLNEDSRKILVLMERQATLAARLVNDLLDVSRVASGTFRILQRPVTAAEVVELAIESCNPTTDSVGRTLEHTVQDGLAPLFGDPDRLGQALRNLVENALKYTHSGGSVAVAAAASETGVRFSVRDNGFGISAHDLPKLGRPFSQLQSSQAGRADGLGLGLYIVKSIVEAHGGTLTVTSDGPNTGSCFSFEIPRHETRADEVVPVDGEE